MTHVNSAAGVAELQNSKVTFRGMISLGGTDRFFPVGGIALFCIALTINKYM